MVLESANPPPPSQLLFFFLFLSRGFNLIMGIISIETENNNCLFFFYFFIGCYIICVIFLLVTLVRLLKYYFTQRRISTMIDQSLPMAVLVKFDNLNEYDGLTMKEDFELLQSLMIKTTDCSSQNHFNEPPPVYREHL